MKQKPTTRHGTRRLNRVPHNKLQISHSPSNDDLYFIAQSVHKAAKTLADAYRPHTNPLGEFDAYPVLFMYRHAVELYLKDIVLNDGGNFLGTGKPDHISVGKSRSISWLAQFVAQIVKTLGWEERFRCDGVEDLSAFKRIVEEVNGIDVMYPMYGLRVEPQKVLGDQLRDFVRRLDALLALLDRTADSLAAEWDLRMAGEDVEEEWPGEDDFKGTIQ